MQKKEITEKAIHLLHKHILGSREPHAAGVYRPNDLLVQSDCSEGSSGTNEGICALGKHQRKQQRHRSFCRASSLQAG
ncbi:hypothetical protein niasHT_025303 [Heterodera trifolii]|uniref:Uncharacterized protein n=1 Tax=Heterodera trifolii TaxID=157864 RepID=A0ABD2KA78_9BILA